MDGNVAGGDMEGYGSTRIYPGDYHDAVSPNCIVEGDAMARWPRERVDAWGCSRRCLSTRHWNCPLELPVEWT